MKRLILSFAVIAASLGLVSGAEASTATTILSVSATAIATCTVSTTPVDFGNMTGLELLTASGDVTVNSSSGTPYNIALDAGSHYDGTLRNISDGINSRPYALYSDSGYLNQWGDLDYAGTYSAGTTLSDTGNGSVQAHIVYGDFAGLSSKIALPPGPYSDTVTVTVYY